MTDQAPLPVDWRTILAHAVALHPRGKAGVADRLNVCRAYVSRAISTGRSAYSEVPQQFIDRVLYLVSDVDCPAAGVRVARALCRKAVGPCPTSNIIDARRWRDCQRCPMKPALESQP